MLRHRGGLGLLAIRSGGHLDLFRVEPVGHQVVLLSLWDQYKSWAGYWWVLKQFNACGAHFFPPALLPLAFSSVYKNGTWCGTGGCLSHEIYPIPAPPAWALPFCFFPWLSHAINTTGSSMLGSPPELPVNSPFHLTAAGALLLVKLGSLLADCCWGVWSLKHCSVVSAASACPRVSGWLCCWPVLFSWNLPFVLHSN